MNGSSATAMQEWRRHGGLALSAMLGLSFISIASTSFGVFMTPLQQEFGWSRAQISFALTIAAIIGTPLAPFSGALADRFGSRRIAIPGLVIAMLVMAALSQVNASIYSWYFAWFTFSLVTIMTKQPVWATAVSGAFSVSRGLAIAIFLSGLGLAQTLSPILARILIDSFGWRGAYVGLAFGWGSITLLMVLLFFHDNFGKRAKPVPGAAAQLLPGGLSLKEGLRDTRMQRITFAICIQAVMGAAAMSHLVPILEWSGTSRASAAAISAILGVASISGKLVAGSLADIVRRSYLPAACFALPGLGYLLLLQGGNSAMLLSIAVFIVGFGSGAAYHMTIFLTVQYSGLRHNGKIFGTMVGILGLAGGVGPLIAGLLYDMTSSYYLLLIAGLPLALLAGAGLLTLGPYPVFAPVQPGESEPVPG